MMWNDDELYGFPELFYHELNEVANKTDEIDDLLTQYDVSIDGTYNNLNLVELWKRIYKKHATDTILITDSESLREDEIAEWLTQFASLFESTVDRYDTLLKFYDANKEKLMDQLSSTNEFISKYNDTPQGSDDFSGDPYTTNLTRTKTTSKTDTNTAMNRLNEIYRNYNNLWKDWVNEFELLFVNKLNGGI